MHPFQLMSEYPRFYHGNLSSRIITLYYELSSNDPWINFNHPNNDYSFRAHNLQFENNAAAWSMAAQNDEEAKLKGYVNWFYPWAGTVHGQISLSSGQDLLVAVRDQKAIVLHDKREFDRQSDELFRRFLGPAFYTLIGMRPRTF